MKINEMDLFYLSYDEPNAEKNWADLKDKFAWAKRVHGVKGFDAAHKACATQSQTDYFITVDGDNVVSHSFMDENIEIDPTQNTVYSFAGKNYTNGLAYGNGGIKLWPKKTVLSLKTHELGETSASKLDFCWDLKYQQMNNIYSVVYSNASPYQAFRSGFREGVKMSLNEGNLVKDLSKFHQEIHKPNLKRLLIWSTIGRDVVNGVYSILGSRLGTSMIYFPEQFPKLISETGFELENISNYEWFIDFFKYIDEWIDSENIEQVIEDCGKVLQKQLKLEMSYMNSEASVFFKKVYENPLRTLEPLTREQEVLNFMENQ